ncbi:MAG: hypothetical protein HYZ42_12620 [Bacteroidetes bacterium]|nr:hypothetical protein [Bacteroidota bacterium]
MRQIFTAILLVLSISVLGQKVKQMTPTLSLLVNKSLEGEKSFNKQKEICETIFKKLDSLGENEDHALEDKYIYENCYTVENYWDILAPGCNWYEGYAGDTVRASSCLKSMKGINYSAGNAGDLSYKTAWIEGAVGYGIGEYLLYRFPPHQPRITKIIVVNGYVKSEKAWRENSRVKRLKVYYNGKPFAILNLADTRREQTFTIQPLGYGDRNNMKKIMANKPWWSLKFEIMDVYKGEKYDETAISEIYFDGMDVHCFAAGTKVLMADGTKKNIETLKQGDSIYTFDEQSDSINSNKSNRLYQQEKKVINLSIGDSVFAPSENRCIRLENIQQVKGPQLTYTIELSSGNCFIVNGIIAKTEKTMDFSFSGAN